MPKPLNPAVLTANNLLDGDTVWWTGEAWSRDITQARIAASPDEAEALMALGGAPAQEAEVVGPYLVDIDAGAPAPRPLLRREAIRADREPTFAYVATPMAEAA